MPSPSADRQASRYFRPVPRRAILRTGTIAAASVLAGSALAEVPRTRDVPGSAVPSPIDSAPIDPDAPLPDRLAVVLDRAAALDPLRAVAVAHRGERVAERGYNGGRSDRAQNIKSASKSVLSALIGIAIERGAIPSVDAPVSTWLADRFAPDPDPRLNAITVDHLLSMRAGLRSTSGGRYGAWVATDDWVREALAQPFVDEPGGRMIYSTGSSHILSAVLAAATGRDPLDLANDWLGPAGVRVDWWERDNQGLPVGGNQMGMTTRSLLSFGELYRRGGTTADGTRVVPAGWIERSWRPHARSRWTGDGYGYAWFLRRIAGPDGTVHPVRFGWGYGGQMVFVVPSADLTVAITSDATRPSARNGYRNQLVGLFRAVLNETEREGIREGVREGARGGA